MTVAELISLLQQQPPEALVLRHNALRSGCLFEKITSVAAIKVALGQTTKRDAIAHYLSPALASKNDTDAVLLD